MVGTKRKSVPVLAAVKKSKEEPTKKKEVVGDHPKTSEMVLNAVKTLKDRKGSSLQAIKKFIGANYNFDPSKYGTLVNKTIKKLVETGSLSQVKGTGANGSFKIASVQNKPAEQQAPKAKASPIKKTVEVKKS